MRGFVLGLLLLVAVSASVLSVRPGGLRRQLRLAGRRLRLAIALGGTYVVASAVLRLTFQGGPVIDFGLPVLAIALAVAFVVAGRDPAPQAPR